MGSCVHKPAQVFGEGLVGQGNAELIRFIFYVFLPLGGATQLFVSRLQSIWLVYTKIDSVQSALSRFSAFSVTIFVIAGHNRQGLVGQQVLRDTRIAAECIQVNNSIFCDPCTKFYSYTNFPYVSFTVYLFMAGFCLSSALCL